MAKSFTFVFILACIGCGVTPDSFDPPPAKPIPTEHMGPGVVRTVEYWTDRGAGGGSDIPHERLVIETRDRKIRQFDHLCDRRIAAWQGLEFKDMTFQYNREWECYHIIEFVR